MAFQCDCVFVVLRLTCGALFLLRVCLPFFMPLHCKVFFACSWSTGDTVVQL